VSAPNLSADERKLLDYYERDARGEGHVQPYGGLGLTRAKRVREALARKGLLIRTFGRWHVPPRDDQQEAA